MGFWPGIYLALLEHLESGGDWIRIAVTRAIQDRMEEAALAFLGLPARVGKRGPDSILRFVRLARVEGHTLEEAASAMTGIDASQVRRRLETLEQNRWWDQEVGNEMPGIHTQVPVSTIYLPVLTQNWLEL